MKKRGRMITFRKFIAVFTTLLLLAWPQAAARVLYDLPSDTKLSAQSAIVVNLGAKSEEDNTMFEKQADMKRSPAALVRLMVGVTAIEIIKEKGIDIDKATGKYSNEGFNSIAGTGLGTVQMSFGEEWTIRDLLSLSMIQTAADACITLAITLSGSHAQFVDKMNELAQKFDCKNTSFANVTGVDSIKQYTTARDLYKIIRNAMEYPEFEPLFAARQYTCKPISSGSNRTYATTNDMLRPTSSYYYSPMSFGKTGYTPSAGRCLASVARDGGYEYLCIVMGVPDTDEQGTQGVYFRDTRALYKWAFNNFTYDKLLNKYETITQIKLNLAWDKDTLPLMPENDLSAIVINSLDKSTIEYQPIVPESIDAPVKKGQIIGKVVLKISMGQVLGEMNLVAGEDAKRSQLLWVWAHIQTFFTSPWFYIVLLFLVLLLAVYIIISIIHNRKNRQNRYKSFKKYR